MTKTPLIEFRDCAVGHDRKAVLEGVSLSIGVGEFWGILGHNGSGKTTLIKTLLGLISPMGGSLLRRGSDAGHPRFGYVPQKEKLDPIYPLTARGVAEMGTYGELRLPSRAAFQEAAELVRRGLEDAGAVDLAHKLYSELSGGQRQRVLIARALAARPEMLVLDEPLSGIDITTQHAILALLRKLKEERGLTVVMVSHRVQAEKSLFTHIAWVDEGEVQAGPAGEIFAHSHVREVFRSEL